MKRAHAPTCKCATYTEHRIPDRESLLDESGHTSSGPHISKLAHLLRRTSEGLRQLFCLLCIQGTRPSSGGAKDRDVPSFEHRGDGLRVIMDAEPLENERGD